MIIGINGRIGSGKDTVGSIIKYLTSYGYNKRGKDYTYDMYLRDSSDILNHINCSSDYKIKKFAGKLKDIASILLSIRVEDFEIQEVKDQVLRSEWWYYTFDKTGKRYPYLSYVDIAEEKGLQNRLKKPTVRQFIQELGTEAMRDVIHPNIWVNALFANYRPPKMSEYNRSKWIITDMRFPNEMEAIKDKRGITVRVNRNISNYKSDLSTNKSPLKHLERGKKLHESETALDNAEFDYVIDNFGSIQTLIELVKLMLKKEKII